MSKAKERIGKTVDRPLQKFATTTSSDPTQNILCKACNREFGMEAYYDHVYDADDCYRAYLASEKKEMSKQ
jgi:hypothetical protein